MHEKIALGADNQKLEEGLHVWLTLQGIVLGALRPMTQHVGECRISKHA